MFTSRRKTEKSNLSNFTQPSALKVMKYGAKYDLQSIFRAKSVKIES